MTTFPITRAQLCLAVESGIKSATRAGYPLNDREADALRKVGREAKRIAFGTYFSEAARCSCPVQRARLVSDNATPAAIRDFTYGYDDFMTNRLHEAVSDFNDYVRINAARVTA